MATFDIIVTGPGGLRNEATAYDAAGAMRAAQILYDETYGMTVGGAAAKKRMCVTILCNGIHVRTILGNRPL